MKIRSKFILNYSILSVILLLLFSVTVVISYIIYRHHNFQVRLHNRAVSSANLLISEELIDSSMLRIIDRNIVTAMDNLEVTIYNDQNKIIYSNHSSSQLRIDRKRNPGYWETFDLKNKKTYFVYEKLNKKYFIEASAVDSYGLSELKSLLSILAVVLILSILIIASFGFYNAVWSLKPFKNIISEVESIDPVYVKKRVSISGNDEISQLAKAFNTLLDRIELAFETEKSFIANASHELRTPVTSVLGQIEVALNKTRSEEEYKAILWSVYDDTTQMATIINGFLNLAEANLANNQIAMGPVRIDELVFSIVEDYKKRKPHYQISVDFITNPEIESQLECLANHRLLQLMISNLIDNACKYSSDKKAKVLINFSNDQIFLTVLDNGIGISEDDLSNIYKPLFRGKNVSGKPGHGLGLAIVKRIVDLHNASIVVNSEVNIGTSVIVTLSSYK